MSCPLGTARRARERFGSVNTNEHTWRHALNRMALGFSCVPTEIECNSILPFDEIERHVQWENSTG